MVGDRLQTLLIDNEHALTELDSAEDRQQFSMQCLLMAKRRQQHGDDLNCRSRRATARSYKAATSFVSTRR